MKSKTHWFFEGEVTRVNTQKIFYPSKDDLFKYIIVNVRLLFGFHF